jgi:arabinan endo-1,5-alpha-L-arabinosidase
MVVFRSSFLALGVGLLALAASCASPATSTTTVASIYPATPSLTTKYTTATSQATASTSPTAWGALNDHDPDLFQDDDGTYYSFSTDANMGTLAMTGIQVRTSKDLMTWTTLATPAFTTIPDAVKQWCFTNYDSTGARITDTTNANYNTTTPNLWAPCVVKLNGKYYMYYGVNATVKINGVSKAHAYIGVATATKAAGPYTDLGKIVRSTTLSSDPSQWSIDATLCTNTTYGAIDPSVVYDADGAMWLNYGSWRNGIAILQLDPSTGLPAVGDTDSVTVASYSTKVAGSTDGASYEGAQVFYPGGAWYYLLISSGDLNTDYSIKMGRRPVSSGINGAYYDADGYDLTTVKITSGNAANSHAHGTKLFGSYVFGSELGWRAPGGMSVIKNSAGKWLMANHVRTNFFASYYFYIQVHQMFFTDSGWPLVNPNEYAGESLQSLTASQVAGTYDAVRTVRSGTAGAWTNFEGTAYTAVYTADAQETTSNSLVLGTDGTISGGTWAGNWYIASGGKVTLALTTASGTAVGTYSGFVVPSYDWSREKLASSVPRTTLALTTLGSDGELLMANLHNF